MTAHRGKTGATHQIKTILNTDRLRKKRGATQILSISNNFIYDTSLIEYISN